MYIQKDDVLFILKCPGGIYNISLFRKREHGEITGRQDTEV